MKSSRMKIFYSTDLMLLQVDGDRKTTPSVSIFFRYIILKHTFAFTKLFVNI